MDTISESDEKVQVSIFLIINVVLKLYSVVARQNGNKQTSTDAVGSSLGCANSNDSLVAVFVTLPRHPGGSVANEPDSGCYGCKQRCRPALTDSIST